VLDIDPILCRLRERIQDPDFIKGLVRRLVDNPHRVCLVMEPDTTLAEREQAAETEKLATIKAGLSEAEIEHIITQAKQLKARQESHDDPDILPEVTREDIPTEFDLAVPTNSTIAAMPAASAACATNGLVYAELIVDLPELNEEQQAMLPFFSQVVDELGCGGRDYLATQALQASVTGGVYAHSSIHASVDNPAHYHAHYMVSGKALERNSESLLTLMMETLEQPRFDEHERLRELVSQARLSSERGVVNQGHSLAMRAASASLSPIAAMQHRRSGLAAIQWIKQLDQSLADDAGMAALEQTLTSIQQGVASSARQMLLIAEERTLATIEQQAATLWHAPNAGATASHFTLAEPAATRIHQAWVTATQVNFCARAFPAVTIEHPDAATLSVLGPFLRNNFLHRNIREQGGAYGGGAGFDASAGAFRFFSYRDPRLQETLEDFDRSIDWLLSTKHEQRLLDEAVLGVISNIDAPGSPAGEVKATFHRILRQRSPEQRRAYSERILAVTLDDLVNVAGRYLQATQANTAVITHQAGAESLRDSLDIIAL
jgi:Zn-dependent M16 (insulinase) family peptidase